MINKKRVPPNLIQNKIIEQPQDNISNKGSFEFVSIFFLKIAVLISKIFKAFYEHFFLFHKSVKVSFTKRHFFLVVL